MRKILVILSVAVLFPSVVCAAPNINQYTENIATKAGYAKADELTLSTTVGRYIQVALSLVGTIFLALTVYAGFLWMTAAGEEDKVTKSKNILQAAIIGLVITLAAYSITAFVVDKIVV